MDPFVILANALLGAQTGDIFREKATLKLTDIEYNEGTGQYTLYLGVEAFRYDDEWSIEDDLTDALALIHKIEKYFIAIEEDQDE